MSAFIVRRLLLGALVIWGVYTLAFFAVNLAPGDPFVNLENPKMQKEDIERLRRKWGYDRPVLARYFVQVRRMFWADAEVLRRDLGGLELEVRRLGEGNGVSARVIEPPATITLEPTPRSLEDDGARAVTLERRADGDWQRAPIAPGHYRFAEADLHVSAVEPSRASELVREGVRVSVRDGFVDARPALAAPPARVALRGENGAEIELLAVGEEGSAFGPTPVSPGAWRLVLDGELVDETVLLPDEPLDVAGPTFDLGTSILQKRPVTEHLAEPLVNTLILATAALFFNFVVGILIGVVSAVRQHGKLDHALTLGALFVYSMPSFWLGLMLMLLFSVRLDLLPTGGMNSVEETWSADLAGFLDMLHHLVLPAIVLGLGGAAATARYQRSALVEVLGADYIRTARAKGLDERRVIWKHAMRNSLLPVITLLGLYLPFLVSGSVITETIFSWPGMGREAIHAIKGRDVFVATGVTLIATTMVVVGNLLSDLLYAVVDPRVRLR